MKENETDKTKKDGRTATLKAKKEKRDGKREQTIKCNLSGRLLGKPEEKEKMLTSILDLVSSVSKMAHKASIVFNRMLLHCLNNDTDLPDLTDKILYNQCFNIGVGNPLRNIPQLAETWGKCFDTESGVFKENPKEKNAGMKFKPKTNFMCMHTTDSIAHKYSAVTYATNFKNMLVSTFKSRQHAYVSRWCKKNDIDGEHCHAICFAVNGWEYRTKLPSEAVSFVNGQREILGAKDEEPITHTWIKTNMENVVRYFYLILKDAEKYEDAKKFTLAPICSIKSHFVTIDSAVLFYLLGGKSVTKCDLKEFIENAHTHFSRVFRIEKRNDRVCFNNMVQTDGVSVCFHYLVPKSTKEIDTKKKENKIKAKTVKTFKTGSIDRRNDRIVAVDPGRVNIVYAVEKLPSDNTMTYKLTRGEYYTSSGVNKLNAKTKVWNRKIKNEEEKYAEVSLKTTNTEEWGKFLTNYEGVYDTLWNAKTQKKIGRERFRVYCLKQKTMDRFMQKIKNGDGKIKGKNIGINTVDARKKVGVAFGAAKFNPSGRSELSVPTTSVTKKFSQKFSLEFVDEFNTTKKCNGCGCSLVPLYKQNRREVRGVRQCRSTGCSRFISRDHNAALNILLCFVSTDRPIQMQRNVGTFTVGKSMAEMLTACTNDNAMI